MLTYQSIKQYKSPNISSNKTLAKQYNTKCYIYCTLIYTKITWFNDEFYKPSKGTAMGSPISGFIAEIFLQYLENLTIKHIIQRNHITFYTLYVDNILIFFLLTLNILIIYDHTPICTDPTLR